MFVAIASLIGAFIGALRARKANGKMLDMLQYAGAFGLIFAMLGLFANIAILRFM
ncbi:hypothetical protein KO498_03280 [Lentibacter algarum]|uniref:hypothetical protein n=1 Tax=Lentibacter algarum TaxID=576131 RepID=UPI001C0669A0|nr:hypothetical protein [Lentibacter algarum]MBU2980828.1 hypothetical protein [Lentibacter algarum]